MQRISLESPLSLGHDVSGAAYLGRVEGTRELVVLREVVAGACSTQTWADIERTSRLRDPRIVCLLGTLVIDEQCYLVSEFDPGLPLAQLLSQRDASQRLPSEILVYIVCEALRALDLAHQQTKESGLADAVHGGLTPWSIVIATSGQVRVSGFGLSQIAGLLEGDGDQQASLRWAAPERFAGAALDERSDVYSVGAVLWEALTCSSFDRSAAHLPGEVSRLSSETTRTEPRAPPAELLACCRRALQPDPGRRYQSANEFLTDLERYVHENGTGREAVELTSLIQILYPGSPYDVRRLPTSASDRPFQPEGLMDIEEALDHDETTTRTELSFIARALTGPPIEKPSLEKQQDKTWGSLKGSAIAVIAIVILATKVANLW